MITDKQRTERRRRHMHTKALYEAQLESATTDAEKAHLRARIAEIVSKIKPVVIPIPIALLPEITKTAEDAAKEPEEHIVRPTKPKKLAPTRTPKKVKNVGSPF